MEMALTRRRPALLSNKGLLTMPEFNNQQSYHKTAEEVMQARVPSLRAIARLCTPCV